MKSLITSIFGLTSMLASGLSSAQNDNMMHGGGGMMGGYYGY